MDLILTLVGASLAFGMLLKARSKRRAAIEDMCDVSWAEFFSGEEHPGAGPYRLPTPAIEVGHFDEDFVRLGWRRPGQP
jgi:hypothetical protein